MFRLIVIFFIVFNFSNAVFGNSNYFEYHKIINNAEKSIFINSNFKEGIRLYKIAFSEFDFVYAKDCLTAIQISLYANDEKSFIIFMKKGFENGLMLRHFRKIKYINSHQFYIKDSMMLVNIYHKHRQVYLKRIDTTALKLTYNIFAKDQLHKNSLIKSNGKFESLIAHEKRYTPLIKSSILELRKLINEKGFVSDRIIGISQKDIMKELRLNSRDLEEYYWQNKNTNPCVIEIEQFRVYELSLYSEMLIMLIIHHPERYHLFNDSFYLDQINKGNIHPKDVATLADITHLSVDATNQSTKCLKYFGVGISINMKPNSAKQPDSLINENRKKFYISKIETDRAKWQFMQKNKMYYVFGFMGQRS